ncbi:peroxiredoxin [Leisingera sp. JC1]|uniref:peroxiredoxin n=1 Tax=Leisingera sp. JC1 TaxID=1855282 RepID=UPI0008029CA1|nr:peroxiredoxin [Leisingera sp. JC1]OBY26710.1 peroxiredoxin [Leisingera sp. JC1]
MATNEYVEALTGKPVPDVTLMATDGSPVNLASIKGTAVVYAYPRTSPPNEPPIEGWDQIPGARGCTPQSKGFAEHYDAILNAGACGVYGLSTQDSAYQREMAERLALPFPILSDEKLELAEKLGLHLFEAGGMTLLTRITLIIENGIIRKAFSQIDNPAENAADVAAFLAQKNAKAH